MPVYFAGAGMFLGDLPIATLGVMAVYYGLERRPVAYLTIATLMVLCKETAAATVGALLVYVLVAEWREPGQKRRLAVIGSPLLALAFFFVWQRWASGSWFPNPWLNTHPPGPGTLGAILEQALLVLWSTFVWQYRWPLVLLIAVSMVWGPRQGLRREQLFFVLIAAAYVLPFCFIFYMTRYVLPVMPWLSLAAVGALLALVRRSWQRWALVGVLLAAFISQYYPHHNTGYYNYDDNMEYLDIIAINRQASQYVEENFPDGRILATWPFSFLLKQPFQGYVRRPLQVVEPGEPFDVMLYVDLPEGHSPLRGLVAGGQVTLERAFTQNGKRLHIYLPAPSPK
jgi:hypothetical protein